MVTMDLDQSYIFAGKHYGPGETDVPEDAAEAIRALMKTQEPESEPETAEDVQHPSDAPKRTRSKKTDA